MNYLAAHSFCIQRLDLMAILNFTFLINFFCPLFPRSIKWCWEGMLNCLSVCNNGAELSCWMCLFTFHEFQGHDHFFTFGLFVIDHFFTFGLFVIDHFFTFGLFVINHFSTFGLFVIDHFFIFGLFVIDLIFSLFFICYRSFFHFWFICYRSFFHFWFICYRYKYINRRFYQGRNDQLLTCAHDTINTRTTHISFKLMIVSS